MDQNRIPILEALDAYQKRNPVFFRVPGHRYEKGIHEDLLRLIGKDAFRFDMTEAEGLDDLHHPEGVILQAQELAADLFGSDECWFLVNGTTCGNEAMILSTIKPGEKILIPRNAHKSVLMGVILAGAIPRYIMPNYYKEWDMYGEIAAADVEDALVADPDIKAVFITSPTYYGVCSDIERIADICHKHQIPLLVDEAHGSHLYFQNSLPKGAIAQGADLVAQSTHKTLSSMTQTSMLHLKSKYIDPERVKDSLPLVMSTSPNYVLMASLDAARALMARDGKFLVKNAADLTAYAIKEIEKIPGVKVLKNESLSKENGAYMDPLRLCFSCYDLGISGYELHEHLYDEHNVTLELSDLKKIVAVITWGNTKDEISRLICGIIKQCTGKKIVRNETVHVPHIQIPIRELEARDAFFAKKKKILWENAIGMISGELIAPYPPGIPLVMPGEILNKETFEVIESYKKMGISLHGPADPDLATFRIIEQKHIHEGKRLE